MKLFTLFFAIIMFVYSCNDDDTKKVIIDKTQLEETLVVMNKKYIDVENTQIDDFLHRRHWTGFKKTKSGLRYNIYKEGIGKTPEPGSIIGIEYSIIDIKGNKIYSSVTLGNKVFQVDKNEEPSGLNEAVKLMKVGAKAKLIVPSYLAYGLLGDENKIGQKVTLIYDIYLVEMK
ncbi:MAG: FKBP-type peptidyl-prolyl cis-trans isomerase [Bacteroidales bacterium]|nr:FKBP-type peptidyl-prolyl cis-trans isomerase [Bacteroidales bacterium]